MDTNPKGTKEELEVWEKVKVLQHKHIFTKTFGDGQVENITRKNDLSGIFVYFNSNSEGTVKLDGNEFLAEVVGVRDLDS